MVDVNPAANVPFASDSLEAHVAATGYVEDSERHTATHPGKVLYSAKMDRDKLRCFYCICCQYNSGEVVARTYLDVYTNGIQANIPIGGCCCCTSCCMNDNARFFYYDDRLFRSDPHKAGCCSPYPWLCPNCCDYCGEVLAFRPAFGTCCGTPRCGFHYYTFMGCCCFCPSDYFCGLAEGEAEKVAAEILQAKTHFERNGSKQPVPVAGAPPVSAIPDAKMV